jgi:glycosyltransferase involved in cell wall biosynthesis
MAASNRKYYRSWRGLDAYIAISRKVADHLVTEGFPSERIHVIPNPVEEAVALASGGTGVLYAGRLECQKGIGVLLDAWRLLPAALRQRRVLHIAGQGELYGLVEDRSRSDPSIRFHGILGFSALEAVASDCAVTVIPSIWDEPFGRGAAESLMRGHALVVTNRGALPDMAAASGGWVVEPEASALAEALEEAICSDDPGRAERGQALAREQYGLVNVGRRYVEVFRSVAGLDRAC